MMPPQLQQQPWQRHHEVQPGNLYYEEGSKGAHGAYILEEGGNRVSLGDDGGSSSHKTRILHDKDIGVVPSLLDEVQGERREVP